jgi:signal transduction histidine kinase
VSDTGPGFSAEDHPHLFEARPMGDTEIPYRGRSLKLGLVVAKRIAQIHGGTITATSAGPSRGSSFVLTIPMVPPNESPMK